MRSITALVLHHSLSPDGPLDDYHAIRNYHLQKGWTDIGYHVVQELVNDKPMLHIGRPWPVTGAHAPGRNEDSLGYCIVGNFDAAPPSPVVWEFAVASVRWLMDVFSLDREDVYAHREVTKNRTCPGIKFDMGRFRDAL